MMKTILVATDFSSAAENAADYAARLSELAGAGLILFHACHVPLAAPELVGLIPSLHEFEKSAIEELEKIAGKLKDKYGSKIRIECSSKCGLATEEIARMAAERKPDLLVMGMQGAGYLAERVFGSVTTTLLRKTTCPVMVIHEETKFRKIKKIVFATSLEERWTSLEPLKEMARLFMAHIFIVHVVQSSDEIPAGPGDPVDYADLAVKFAGTEYSFHLRTGENVVEGLNTFVSQNQMDMVTMMTGKHSFPANLFKEPHTKQMAFHTGVPLLVLHEPTGN